MNPRPSWYDYYMQIARAVATRSTCPRKHVGAIIVRDHHILATGYNGSLPSKAHCDEVGCDIQNGHCTRTIHAELNALAHAAKEGVSVNGAEVYSTLLPCWSCQKVLISAGIQKFHVGEER